MSAIDETITGYVYALCWIGLYDETGERVDADPYAYGPDDCTPELLADIRGTVADFLECNASDVAELLERHGATPESIGHDLYLTRNRHGAGFWDRGYGPAGDRLTDAAHPYGEHVATLTGNGKVDE